MICIPTDIARRWSREFFFIGRSSFAGNGKQLVTAEQKEIAHLKKALKEAEIERDILKKAVGISPRAITTINLGSWKTTKLVFAVGKMCRVFQVCRSG